MPNAKQNLVIVESPSKAKTIGKYLGPDYQVKASMGHLRDLPKSTLSVDIEHDFEPEYQPLKGKEDIIADLRKAAKGSGRIYLATDPDREGEAISWHLKYLLNIPDNETYRVTFNEITRNVVQESIQHPRPIDQNLVDAQQARRVLDRIVGYQLSPLLWKKIRKGLSAGRVQSVATRLVVDRENEIRAFVPQEYWTLDVNLNRAGKPGSFTAHYYGDPQKRELTSEQDVQSVLDALEGQPFSVTGVKKSEKKRTPAPPFITSTLQQEASKKLNFQSQRTMRVAQELYEGVNLGHENGGVQGLITYMRTDSLRVAAEAQSAALEYIAENYGRDYCPEKPRVYRTKASAQDAHEAIRPSVPSLTPERVKPSLTADQYKLYKLIWDRFIASLMANCVHDTCQVDIRADKYLFKASGYTVRFEGYTVLYVEGKDEESDENGPLPTLNEGDVLHLRELGGNQHFTQPPPRYTEATLIKTLEENGIGRPSTYAPTISTILAREYIEREGKALRPTALGEVTTRLMKEQFPEVVDVEFTANMEQQLDGVEHGKADWVDTLDAFYKEFSKTLERAEENLSGEKIKVPEVESDVVCEQCGRKMVIKSGRYGKFLACPGYPECKNTKRIVEETGAVCPKCGGSIVAKKSKNNRKFFGCSNYPQCDFVTWSEPTKELCPKCGKTLFKKKGRNAGVACLTEGCGFEKGPHDEGEAPAAPEKAAPAEE